MHGRNNKQPREKVPRREGSGIFSARRSALRDLADRQAETNQLLRALISDTAGSSRELRAVAQ
jgi:hypothetical protein